MMEVSAHLPELIPYPNGHRSMYEVQTVFDHGKHIAVVGLGVVAAVGHRNMDFEVDRQRWQDLGSIE